MNNTFTIQIDADVERRRALAKIYSLLIRLVEQSTEQRLPSVDKEQTERPVHIHLETSTEESLPEERNN